MSESDRIWPMSWLRACLAGDAPLEPPAPSWDTLDLSQRTVPDLRFSDPADLALLLAHPAMGQVAHLRLAEGGRYSLPAILDACSRGGGGGLRTLVLRTTEAFSRATTPTQLAQLAAHPAARSLRSLRLERTALAGAGVLAEAPWEPGLEELVWVGGWAQPADLQALGGAAPALQRLRWLTLTPDRLTPALAGRMAASKALERLERITLPLLDSSGEDGMIDYAEDRAFGRSFPAVVRILQERWGAEQVRITAPHPGLRLPRALQDALAARGVWPPLGEGEGTIDPDRRG